jgi:hypothetical protein
VNQVKGDLRSPKKKPNVKRKSGHEKALDRAYAQGINDQSRHNYDNDSYYDQDNVSSMKANLSGESTPRREAKETTEAKVVAKALEAPVGKVEARVCIAPPDPNTILHHLPRPRRRRLHLDGS